MSRNPEWSDTDRVTNLGNPFSSCGTADVVTCRDHQRDVRLGLNRLDRQGRATWLANIGERSLLRPILKQDHRGWCSFSATQGGKLVWCTVGSCVRAAAFWYSSLPVSSAFFTCKVYLVWGYYPDRWNKFELYSGRSMQASH